MKVWIVYAKGEDWENVEAFAKESDADDYAFAEARAGDAQVVTKMMEIDFQS